ncbi:hypothetical protein M0P98_08880 [bacterium]|nr:hypothetical protein [bacterium]
MAFQRIYFFVKEEDLSEEIINKLSEYEKIINAIFESKNKEGFTAQYIDLKENILSVLNDVSINKEFLEEKNYDEMKNNLRSLKTINNELYCEIKADLDLILINVKKIQNLVDLLQKAESVVQLNKLLLILKKALSQKCAIIQISTETEE